MRERTPQFLAAQDRVKVGHFTRKGFDLQGVCHVGASDGEEIPYYLALGAPKVIAIEPLPSAVEKLVERFHGDMRIDIYPYALSDHVDRATLQVSEGDGKGSTFLKEVNSSYAFRGFIRMPVVPFTELKIDLAGFNTLVVDVQGMELQVLRGFREQLQTFDFLNIECSEIPWYEGEAAAQGVVDWLAKRGFVQDSPIVSHDDIMFINRRVL